MSRLNAAAALACAIVALASSAADANPLRHQQKGIILCNDRGCSDHASASSSTHAPRRSIRSRRGTASIDRGCLTSETRAVLERAEAHFGVKFTLVSTCRPGAIIAGTNHVSEHAHGKAVDLLVPRGTAKAAVVRYFYANAKGVTMVYRNMPHVHFDTGPYHKLACGGCGGERRARRHARYAHAR